MTHEERTKASNRQDPAWAARVVRNIGQIETDFFHAAGTVSEEIMREAVKAIRKVAIAPWLVVEAGLSAQIVCPEWKMTKGVGTGDMWLELSELAIDEDDDEHSWLAAATKAGPTQLGVELVFRRGLQDHAETMIRDTKVLAALSKLGFTRSEADPTLFIEVEISAEILAKGFEQNDITAALAPVGQAFAKAIAAKAELDKLLEQIRGAAKRK